MRRPLQLTTQQLDYLVAVADHATWADAAATLGVTPSALSQGLAELERRLGIDVFERVGRRRLIADRCTPVVDYARRVLADTGDLERWIGEIQRGDSGSLHVGMIDAAAIGHYPEVLRHFRESHSSIEFTLRVAPSAELLELLLAGTIDVAVVVKPPIQPIGVEWSDILIEPLAVYSPSGRTASAPQDWGPWVAFASTSHTRQLVAAAVEAAGSKFDVVAESNQPDVLREMVRLGLGWTVLPVIQAESEPDPLVRAQPEPLMHRTLVAARRAGAVSNPLLDELVELLTTDDDA